MSQLRLDVSVRGDDIAARRLRELAGRAEDARLFFRQVARIMLDESRRRWQSSGFARWAPLDPDTVRRKVRQGQDPRILRQTGALERALTVWGARGQVLEFDRDEARLGIGQQGAVFYGVFHHRGEGNPMRPVLGVTSRLRQRALEALHLHLFGGRNFE